MKRNKPLFIVLAPVSWSYSNRQLQNMVRKLAKAYKVVFIFTFRMKRVSLWEFVTNRRKRSAVIKFVNRLHNPKINLIIQPVFITLRKYRFWEQVKGLDLYLFKKEVEMLVRLSGSRQLVFWVWSLHVIEPLKKIKSAMWFFDWFDRIFDFWQVSNNIIYRKNELWLLEKSNLVFVNSNRFFELASGLEPKSASKIVKTPVGYSVSQHLACKSKKKRSGVVVGYVGGISNRIDFDLVVKVLDQNADIQFWFAGPRREDGWTSPTKKMRPARFYAKIGEYRNVKLIESTNKVSEQVKLMENFSIGWIPYDLKVPFNQYCLPTKFFEYLALGLPVISTTIPTLLEYPDMISFISCPDSFRTLLEYELETNSQRKIKKRKQLAASHDTEQKSIAVLRELEKQLK